MRNPIQKFRQHSTVLEKPGILPEKLKTLTSSNYHRVYYFLLKFLRAFPSQQILQKRVRDFSLFRVQILSYFQKYKKTQFLLTLRDQVFYIFLITQDLNKIKKNSKTLLQTLLSRKRVQYFSKKKSNSMAVGARQSFHFFKQFTWFLKNNRVLRKFRI